MNKGNRHVLLLIVNFRTISHRHVSYDAGCPLRFEIWKNLALTGVETGVHSVSIFVALAES
jgi:hypothetical protein